MDPQAIMARAREANIRLTRFLYCDNAGITRGKATSTASLPGRLESGIGLTLAMMAMNMLDQLQPVEGVGPVGEVRLTPDLSTYVELPYSPRSAALLCDMLQLDGSPWAVCPRNFLKRAVARAEAAGLRFQAACEPEWTLAVARESAYLPPQASPAAEGYLPIDRSLCFSGAGFTTADAVIGEVIDALEAQGLRVQLYHPEAGSGQQELSISHADALRAADNHILYRETVHNVAASLGYTASFAPKPFPDDLGNGCHIHISALDRDGRNAFYAPDDRYRLSTTGYAFVAGVLEHLPALVAITCPSVNSYHRLQPHSWSSAYAVWGPDNREAAVRVASPARHDPEGSVNVELKASDSSANPYLALGALMLAGLDGIERRLPAPERLLALADPGSLSEAERERRGIRRLPASLNEALDALGGDRVLLDGLGEPLARAFMAVRRSEAEYFADKAPELEFAQHFVKY